MIQYKKKTVIMMASAVNVITRGRFKELKKFHLAASMNAIRSERSITRRKTLLNSINLRADFIYPSLRLKYLIRSIKAYTIETIMYVTNIMASGNIANPSAIPAGPPQGRVRIFVLIHG